MDGSLSGGAQRVMGSGRDEASRLHHEYLGTEHLLLGIAAESDGVAGDVLKSLGITLERVRSGVEQIVGIGPDSASPDDRGVTPRANQALGFAREEADHRGSPQVEPEHLLLGICREAHGVAAQVLRDLGAPPEDVRARCRGCWVRTMRVGRKSSDLTVARWSRPSSLRLGDGGDRMKWPWKRLRLIAYSVVGTALALVGVLLRWTSIEDAGVPLLAACLSLGTLMVLIVILDVTLHAWRGEGQACRNCGHIRRMKPFRVYVRCPNCGEG